MNPKNPRQKVAFKKVNLGGGDKFHGACILEFWLKVDVEEAHVLD
jgi:hypothetical protein